MALSTTTAAAILRPEDVGQLVVQPVAAGSIAMQLCTVVTTASTSYRIPIVTADSTAGWYAEGGTITPSDATTTEVDVIPKKVAGLTIVSRELAADSSPEASAMVGQSLARDIAAKIDAAFFANTTANGPDGLLSITPNAVDTAGTIAALTNLDVFAEAVADAETVGATITSFVCNPADALTLAKLKDETGSARPLLGTDPSMPTRRMILGVPLHVSPACAQGSFWGIPKDRVFVIVRQDATLDVDKSAYFASDSVGVRATMRVGFGFAHEVAVQRVHDVTPA